MQLIVITPDKAIRDEANIINHLFANGLQRLHVRKPLFTTGDYRDYILAIDSKYHSKIVIHGSFELYNAYRLGGIHLNSAVRNDMTTWPAINDISPSVMSTSFHYWEEIEVNEFHYGYVFISPVFDSISKKEYKAGIDLSGAIRVKQKLAKSQKYCPSIIGLGGVGKEQIQTLYQYGFDGAAVLGAIWETENQVENFVEINNAINSILNH